MRLLNVIHKDRVTKIVFFVSCSLVIPARFNTCARTRSTMSASAHTRRRRVTVQPIEVHTGLSSPKSFTLAPMPTLMRQYSSHCALFARALYGKNLTFFSESVTDLMSVYDDVRGALFGDPEPGFPLRAFAHSQDVRRNDKKSRISKESESGGVTVLAMLNQHGTLSNASWFYS